MKEAIKDMRWRVRNYRKLTLTRVAAASPNHVSMSFRITGGKRKRRFTLDEECNLDDPYTDCYCRNDLLSVPNGNADDHNERLSFGRS